MFPCTSSDWICNDILLPSNGNRSICIRTVHYDRSELRMAYPFSTPLVSKYDGINDGSSRIRVYLTGGFKKPRELTWVTGVVLSVITVSFGVTGYSLPWDQVGYWAVKIVTGVPDAIPVIGSFVVELLRGSVGVGQPTLTRFYSLHTFVLPLLAATFMLMHFLMIRKQGISGPL